MRVDLFGRAKRQTSPLMALGFKEDVVFFEPIHRSIK